MIEVIQGNITLPGTAQFVNNKDGNPELILGGQAVPDNGANPRWISDNCVKIALAGGTDTGGGIASWANPFAYPVIVQSIDLDVTTVATAACTVEVGQGTSATTAYSNLGISTQDVHSATVTIQATTVQKVPVGSFVNVSTASGASAGLAGYLYVNFIPAVA